MYLTQLKNQIGKIEENGKEYYFVHGEKIPAEFGWLAVAVALMKSGFKLKFHYGGEVYDKPAKFEYDKDYRGFAPVIPDKIEVFKEVDVLEERGRLTEILGRRVRRKLVKVIEISDRSLLDPDAIETLSILNAIGI